MEGTSLARRFHVTLRGRERRQRRVFATLTRNMFGLWSLVKRFREFDGMIVRIPVNLSSLLLALTSKFYFANI